MSIILIVVKEGYVHVRGQNHICFVQQYSSWMLHLTVQIIRHSLLYMLSCTLLDKISWFLNLHDGFMGF